MNIYVDNHASTRCDDRVLDAMIPYFGGLSAGNPSSGYHQAGRIAENACQQSRNTVASVFGCHPGRVIFTASATEANNLALVGAAFAARDSDGRNHIVSTEIEHPSVLRSLEHLKRCGFNVTLVPVDTFGRVSAKDVLAAVKDETILVSVMSANNEVGTLQPIEQIAAGIPHGVLMHSDACQSAGRLPLGMVDSCVDMLTIAGHKMHGPKGIGALCIQEGVRLTPQILGNHQEFGLRAGTPNVPGIVGLAKACEIYQDEWQHERSHVISLRDTFYENILSRVGDVVLNGHPALRLPGNLHLSFVGIPSDVLMAELPSVCVSSGAACTSGRGQPSHVLRAMNLSAACAESSIRFGFGRFNTPSEVIELSHIVAEAVKRIRRRGNRRLKEI